MKKNVKSGCCAQGRCTDYSSEVPKINRIAGQLEGIRKMIAANRCCPDVLIQLRAIRSAIRAVEGNILKSHLQSCVSQSFFSDKEHDKKIDEIKQLFNRFED